MKPLVLSPSTTAVPATVTARTLDRTDVMIWLTDQDGRCVLLNRAWTVFTGESSEADLGDGWRARMHPEDLDAYAGAFADAVNRQEAFFVEGRFRRHDGEFRWLHVSGLPRFAPNGRFAGHAGAAIDVTELEQRTSFRFTATELQLLMRVAEEVNSLTADLRRSKSRLRELSAHADHVRENEQRELARALHDDVGQLFTSIRLELAAAIGEYQRAPHPAPSELVDRLQAAAGLLDVAHASVRRMATTLRPPILDHLGIVEAVRWEAGTFAKRTGIRCRVTVRIKTTDIPHRVVTALYRILLEALNNVARHAHAGTAWIFLRTDGDLIYLHIRDNGRGITPQEATNPHTMGLLGMRERAIAIGGTLHIHARRHGGTRILAVAPILASSQMPHA